jgi:hypothetical protein
MSKLQVPVKGACGHNFQWRAWTDEEIQRIAGLKPGVVVVMLYGTPAAEAQIEAEHRLLSLLPDCRFIYRAHYGGGVETRIGPTDWAREIVSRASRHPRTWHKGELVWEICPANELNLASIGGDEDWQAQIEWLKAVGREIKRQLPNVVLHLPAPSPVGQYWNFWLDAVKDAELMELYDRVDLHCYPGSMNDDFEVARYMPKPIDITEFNFGYDFWDYNPDGFQWIFKPRPAESASFFTLGGEGEENRSYFLIEPYYTAYKNLVTEGNTVIGNTVTGDGTSGVTIPPQEGGQTMPTPYAEWEAAYMAKHNDLLPQEFEYHLHRVALGQATATRNDLFAALGNIAAAERQAELIAEKLLPL